MFRLAIPLFAVLLFLSVSAVAAPVPLAESDDSLSHTAIMLLEYCPVQRELQMTAEQRVAIYDGLDTLEETLLQKTAALLAKPNAPEGAFDKVDDEVAEAMEKLFAESVKNCTPAQRSRLRELSYRVRGVVAFTDPTVEKQLQLTDEQKKKAAKLAKRVKDAMERYQSSSDATKAAQEIPKLTAFRNDRLKEMESTLTADQKSTWSKMLGKLPTKFKTDELWWRIVETDMMILLPSEPGKHPKPKPMPLPKLLPRGKPNPELEPKP